MSAALKLIQELEGLSEKPLLGEKRPMLSLVWENPKLSAGTPKEKSKAKLRLVSGQSVYAYVSNNPVNFIDPEGLWVPQVARALYLAWRLVRAVIGSGDPTPPSQEIQNPTLPPTRVEQPYVPPTPKLPSNLKLPSMILPIVPGVWPEEENTGYCR